MAKLSIKMNDPRLAFIGRVDFTDPLKPMFTWPGSSVELKAVAEKISVKIKNYRSCYHNYVGISVNGEDPKKTEITELKEETEVVLIDGLDATKESRITIYKPMDAAHFYEISEIILEAKDKEAELLEKPELPARRMEVFGDSVSAGEVSEAVEYVGKSDPEGHEGIYSNSWYGYSFMTARKLGAQLYDEAQGGAALFDKTGWFHGPDFVGMETIYNKLRFNDQIMPMTDWDFARYTPHVVVIAIGQNDANPENYMGNDEEKSKKWKEGYKKFIETLREKYPKAQFILTTTILCHSKEWDDAIDEVAKSFNDKKVQHFIYTNNGTGTPGHIRKPEAEVMSDELSAFINSLGEEIWQD